MHIINVIGSERTCKKHSANALVLLILQLFQIMYPDELQKKSVILSRQLCSTRKTEDAEA